MFYTYTELNFVESSIRQRILRHPDRSTASVSSDQLACETPSSHTSVGTIIRLSFLVEHFLEQAAVSTPSFLADAQIGHPRLRDAGALYSAVCQAGQGEALVLFVVQ